MKQSRTTNSFINVTAAVVGQVIALVVSFVARIVFVRQLGEIYLGVNSLFTNIVGLLSLAELGVGTAINYSLYKPLAEGDTEKIKSLMLLYKKAYYAIGIIILIIGLLLLPFLDVFLKASDTGTVPDLRLIFFLFVLNSSCSYFYSFKRALIIADQHRYVATIFRYVFYCVMNILQIVVLIWTQNFFLYLIIMLACTLAENICVSTRANRMYPYLMDKDVRKLDSESTNAIKKNTVALLYHKVGSSVVSSTDNILISKIIGLVTVGIYSNYLLITNALNIILGQFFMSITASIGNLGATEEAGKSQKILDELFFINFWIVCVVTTSLYAAINILIRSWFGETMLLDNYVLLCITLNVYFYQIRRTVMTFRDAYGLFWYDRYKALAEAILNLIISIILGIRIGLAGILIGTIVSMLFTSVWIEPYVLYKYAFGGGFAHYLLTLLKYTVITFGMWILCKWIIGLLPLAGLSGFVLGVVICAAAVSAVVVILYLHTDEFQYFCRLIMKFINMLKSKRITKHD